MVHWVGEGSNVIICLARDSSPRNKGGVSPSALFISYDYGKNFTNKTENFRLGNGPDSGYAQIDKFFNHPKYPEFVSIIFMELVLIILTLSLLVSFIPTYNSYSYILYPYYK